MPRVIYDSQVFAEQQHGGVSRYFVSLAEYLLSATAWNPVMAMGLHIGERRMPAGMRFFGPRLRMPAIAHTIRARRLVNTLFMDFFQPRADNLTVYHPTWYFYPMIERWNHLPMVVTIHDLIPESWPAVTTSTQLVHRRLVLDRARSVICVSETTKARLADHYPMAAERAIVARLGLSPLPAGQNPPDEGGPYLLHIGKRGAYKDFATVIRALAHAPNELQMVAAGGGPLRRWEMELLDKHRMNNRLRVEPTVSDERLADLLGGSKGLVSASREEGFGLPALEALAVGKPVILSDIPAYRELYSPWAIFFQPGNPEALGAAMFALMSAQVPASPSIDSLRTMFSWENNALVTAEAYELAIG